MGMVKENVKRMHANWDVVAHHVFLDVRKEEV
jgi:hypothetical protein